MRAPLEAFQACLKGAVQQVPVSDRLASETGGQGAASLSSE